MADFSLRVEKITGKASESAICGVFTKRINLADSSVGTLVSCILIKTDSGEDLAGPMQDIFEIAEKKIDGAQGSLLDCLKSGVAAAKNYKADLEINFVHAFFYENVCYVARLGNEVKIWAFDPPKSVEITFESGSGPIADGQIYLIATEAFLSIFDTSALSQEAEVDFGEVIDGIATDIAGEENQSEIGAAFVNVSGQEDASKDSSNKEEEEQAHEVSGTGEEVAETEEEAVVADSEEEEPRAPRFKNPMAGFYAAIGRELKRLVKGDAGAVRRNIISLAIVIVLVLVVSAAFTFQKKHEREKLAQFNEHLTAASAKYSEGSAIIELNKSRARDILIEADREVKAALGIKGDDAKAKELAADIEKKLKETEVASNVEFKEVANLNDSLKSLGLVGNTVVGVSGDKLYKVNLATKDVEDISSKGGVSSGFIFDNRSFVTSGEKIYRIDLNSGDTSEVGNKSGNIDVAVFSGNVYVLSSNSIFKFVPIEAGYSTGSEYLNSPENFSSKSKFAIDGSIWVTSGDKIFKYTRGQKENFEVSGQVGGMGELSLIFTNANLDNLYVVDSTNSALLVIGKDGVYKKVLQSSEFARAADLVVDEVEETLYIASGSRILEASLK